MYTCSGGSFPCSSNRSKASRIVAGRNILDCNSSKLSNLYNLSEEEEDDDDEEDDEEDGSVDGDGDGEGDSSEDDAGVDSETGLEAAVESFASELLDWARINTIRRKNALIPPTASPAVMELCDRLNRM